MGSFSDYVGRIVDSLSDSIDAEKQQYHQLKEIFAQQVDAGSNTYTSKVNFHLHENVKSKLIDDGIKITFDSITNRYKFYL